MFRQPDHGYSLAHELAVIVTALTCCTWPVFASRPRHPSLFLTRTPCYAAAALSLGLVGWYAPREPRHSARTRRALRCLSAATVAARGRRHDLARTDAAGVELPARRADEPRGGRRPLTMSAQPCGRAAKSRLAFLYHAMPDRGCLQRPFISFSASLCSSSPPNRSERETGRQRSMPTGRLPPVGRVGPPPPASGPLLQTGGRA